MFRRFPNQSIADFITLVEESVSKEKNSVPNLVERIQACKRQVGESYQELRACLVSLKADELKKVLKAVCLKPAKKKDDSLKMIDSFVNAGETPSTDSVADEVQRAFLLYDAIKTDLRTITLEEMRARFSGISNQPKEVLAGLLSKLGYSAGGSKGELEAKLLDNLTSLKISHDQTKQIGS